MHVLHRAHLPRLIRVSLVAAILAIVISLVLASRLSNISQPGNGMSVSVHPTAPAPASPLHTTAPGWASNPFASLLSRPVSQPWQTARH